MKEPKDYKYFTERQKADWARFCKERDKYDQDLEAHWQRASIKMPIREEYDTAVEWKTAVSIWHFDWSLDEPARPVWDRVDNEICWLAANR